MNFEEYLFEALSQAARQALALNRLEKKQPNTHRGWTRAMSLSFKKKDAMARIPTSPKRDVVRAAMRAQLGESSSDNPLLKYILTSPENVMSGATRVYRKGATRARKTGKGNEDENKILAVPRTFKSMMRRARRAKAKGREKRASNQAFTNYAIETLNQKKIEDARMTRKQLDDESRELLGNRKKGSGIVSGMGYNKQRARKEFRRAEKRGAEPVTDQDVDQMSATGVAGSVGARKGPVGRALGRLALRARAKKQVADRGRLQDIGGMEKQMKKDPDAFAPPTRLTPDPRNPHHQKYTQIGGRTRQTISRLVRKKPMDMLTIPSQKYAGSAERAKKWIASGGRERRKQELAKQGRHLRGQDYRLGPI